MKFNDTDVNDFRADKLIKTCAGDQNCVTYLLFYRRCKLVSPPVNGDSYALSRCLVLLAEAKATFRAHLMASDQSIKLVVDLAVGFSKARFLCTFIADGLRKAFNLTAPQLAANALLGLTGRRCALLSAVQ
jgi:hypothetical protein